MAAGSFFFSIVLCFFFFLSSPLSKAGSQSTQSLAHQNERKVIIFRRPKRMQPFQTNQFVSRECMLWCVCGWWTHFRTGTGRTGHFVHGQRIRGLIGNRLRREGEEVVNSLRGWWNEWQRQQCAVAVGHRTSVCSFTQGRKNRRRKGTICSSRTTFCLPSD